MKPFLIFGSTTAVIVLAVALALTQPWRYFTSSTIDEALPTAAESAVSTASISPAALEPQVLGSGTFASLDHETSGSASIIALADGTHVLRLEDLASVDGPDLKVVLTDRTDDFGALNADEYVSLGALKATHGNHNYELPAGLQLPAAVVIWCERFNSPFGVAYL